MCFMWLSEETVPFVSCVINRLVFVNKVETVYCAVRPESLYKTDSFVLKGLKWNEAHMHHNQQAN